MPIYNHDDQKCTFSATAGTQLSKNSLKVTLVLVVLPLGAASPANGVLPESQKLGDRYRSLDSSPVTLTQSYGKNL